MRLRSRKNGYMLTRRTPGTRMVFRPSSFKLGPSHGCAGFELKPDGELVESQIAAADGSLKRAGKWKLSDGGKLYFYREDPSKPAKMLEKNRPPKTNLSSSDDQPWAAQSINLPLAGCNPA